MLPFLNRILPVPSFKIASASYWYRQIYVKRRSGPDRREMGR
jgi:hypothetical protein